MKSILKTKRQVIQYSNKDILKVANSKLKILKADDFDLKIYNKRNSKAGFTLMRMKLLITARANVNSLFQRTIKIFFFSLKQLPRKKNRNK